MNVRGWLERVAGRLEWKAIADYARAYNRSSPLYGVIVRGYCGYMNSTQLPGMEAYQLPINKRKWVILKRLFIKKKYNSISEIVLFTIYQFYFLLIIILSTYYQK